MTDNDEAIGYGGGLSGRRQNADIADTLHLRDVAVVTDFGITIAVMGLRREMTTWRFLIKDGSFQSIATSMVACSAGVVTAV